MSDYEGTFCLVVHSHLPWLPHHGSWPVGEEWLYQAWAHSYLPMVDLLRRFASVPLALAAYNAGPGAVAGCMCIPPYPETRGYVARILGLLHGAGEPVAGAGLTVRLVR